MNLIPLGWLLQPFPHALITSAVPRAGFWVHFPLLILEQHCRKPGSCRSSGSEVINAPFSAAIHIQISHRSSASRDTGWGKHWGPLWQCLLESCLCKVCQQQPSWGLRRDFFFVFFLRGLVLRFSWGNQPLSPHPGRCPLRFAGFSGILHGVRRYSLPVCWICSNVPGRTAEIVFFAQRGMLCMAGGQTKQMARYGRAMSRHERGRRDLTKRILASIKKRTRGNTTQKPSKICFCSGGLHFFPPFLRLAFTRLCPDRRLGFEKECPDLWGPL